MARARIIVVEGPDVGAAFEIPPEGGGIGRGEGNIVRLTDLAVSRSHCALEVRDGELYIVDPGSRNPTRLNGQIVTAHALVEGDEITVGKSRLAYLPHDGRMPLMFTSARSRVTHEMSAADLFPQQAGPSPSADRAHRHLAALARLGEGLRGVGDQASATRTACESLRDALGASRALLFLRDASGALSPVSSAVAIDDPAGEKLQVAREVLDKVTLERKALIVAATNATDRPALAAPILREGRESAAAGLVYADRRPDPLGATVGAGGRPLEGWDESDLKLAACVAHLVGAALDGVAARDALARENQALVERFGGSREFIGQSQAAQDLLAFASKVGRTDSTVLVLGPSGAGKEMVASAIHNASRRAKGPFVCVNCAALSETVLESELFGHEKGAFTGAVEKKLGRFEMADGGTLFLDEVGEISLKCQAKFLRVLEERRFERVGGTRPIATDVRVIAATNRNLEEMIERGEFREDLFFRISVIRAEVPPLCDRPEDIALISDHFLKRLRFQTGRRVTGFTPEARRALAAYRWPGNVRELRNAIEHAMVLGEGETIGLDDLPPHVVQGRQNVPRANPVPASTAQPTQAAGPSSAGTPPTLQPRSLRQLEREGIVAALAATNGNKVQAAALLEIDRSTLYKKLKEYDISAAEGS
jgi:DNA-binding NtrC family response regulator